MRISLALWLGLVTLAVYWPATRHEFLNYDDDAYVTANSHVRTGLTWDNIKWSILHAQVGNWHPVTMWSHLLDCQVYGLNSWGHHLTNVLLHAVNTVLVFLWLNRLTGAVWRSWVVAALFGWHPLHVESVAWLAERKDVLSGCFGLLCLMCYTRYARHLSVAGKNPVAGVRSPFYWLALVCFALGLMSKPMLVTWPFVLLLLDYWPLNRLKHSDWGRLVVEKIPFLLLAAGSCVMTYVAQRQGGAVVAVQDLALDLRVANALISYCRYLGKLFWPTNLAAFYPLPEHWPAVAVWLAGGLLLGLSVLWFRLRRAHPYLLMGWLWFVGTLVPVIGLVQAGKQAMADRYTYLPSLGVLIMVIWGTHEFTRRWRQPALMLAAAAAGIACLAVTRQQLGYWQDGETLFRHALKVTDENYFAHRMVGDELQSKGRLDAAIASYQEAIRLKPYFFAAEYNLGHALNAKGRPDEAFKCYLQVVKWQPDFSQAYNDLGNILQAKGRLDEAVANYRQAIKYKPDYAEAHSNLGLALLNQGQPAEAINEFQEAVNLKPDYAHARKYFGFALLNQGRLDEAIRQCQEAVRLNPDDSECHYNLGVACGKKGRMDEAISQYQEAIRLNPGYLLAHNNLGNALFRQGRRDEAIQQYRETLRLKPDFAEAHNNLGYVLLSQGQKEESISQFQQALRLKPDYADARQNLARAQAINNPASNH